MEAEERPAKLVKLHHSPKSENATFAEPPEPIGGTHDDGAREPQAPEGLEKDDEPPLPVAEDSNAPDPEEETPKMSKNQLKKLRRQQEWEAGRDARKAKRKEQTKAKRARKRVAIAEDEANGTTIASSKYKIHKYQRAQQLPITFVFDCDFDDLMYEKELKSLASQLTRSYSDNKNAHLRAHLAIASFGGKLKERFEGVLASHHESWRGVRWFSEDFVEVAERAKGWMRSPTGGKLAGVLAERAKKQQAPAVANGEQTGGSAGGDAIIGKAAEGHSSDVAAEPKTETSENADPTAGTAEDEGDIIYLSSESEHTLTELKPYSTYIIGGLVDHNRHKGICYKRAMDRGIRTAKLPIGELLQMDSRKVLATNHVCEIMLKWLELGDWGEAFMKVIPKRKGGALKGTSGDNTEQEVQAVKETNEDAQGDSDWNEYQSELDEDSENGGVSLQANGESIAVDTEYK